jgi:UDP-N-acetylglucosamine 2-epimerase
MLDQVMTLAGMHADFDLDIMRPGQSLTDLTCGVLSKLTETLALVEPDCVLVQGDTTTAFTAALASFYARRKVGHIEAGLRSGDINAPWPEEMNRILVGEIASLHFAPTATARDNLLKQGIAPAQTYITGNTIIDTLLFFSRKIDNSPAIRCDLARRFPFLEPHKRIIVVTAHRRESFDGGIKRVCEALTTIGKRTDVQIVFPVHPNPRVFGPVKELLGGQRRIHLIEPQDYLGFLYLLKRSYLVLSDSGGIQEEAPSLRKPVLVMRDNTERPEGLAAGAARLTGTQSERIVAEVCRLLDDSEAYERMISAQNPYGDGRSGEKIVDIMLRAA